MELVMLKRFVNDSLNNRYGLGQFYSDLSNKEKRELINELEEISYFVYKKSKIILYYERDLNKYIFDRLQYDTYKKIIETYEKNSKIPE